MKTESEQASLLTDRALEILDEIEREKRSGTVVANTNRLIFTRDDGKADNSKYDKPRHSEGGARLSVHEVPLSRLLKRPNTPPTDSVSLSYESRRCDVGFIREAPELAQQQKNQNHMPRPASMLNTRYSARTVMSPFTTVWLRIGIPIRR